MQTHAIVALLTLNCVVVFGGCAGRSQSNGGESGGKPAAADGESPPADGDSLPSNKDGPQDAHQEAVAAHHVRLLLRYDHGQVALRIRSSSDEDVYQQLERMLQNVRGNSFATNAILTTLRSEVDDSGFNDAHGRAWALLAYVGAGAKSAMLQLLEELGANEMVAEDEAALIDILRGYGHQPRPIVAFDDEPNGEYWVPVLLTLGQLGADAQPAMPRLLELLAKPEMSDHAGLSSDIGMFLTPLSRDLGVDEHSFMSLVIWAAVRIDPNSDALAARLLELLDGHDEGVRHTALTALLQMKTVIATLDARLQTLVEDDDLWRLAITALVDRSFATNDAKLRDELAEHPDKGRRFYAQQEIFRHVVQSGDIDAIVAGLGDPLASCRSMAVEALGPRCSQSNELALRIAEGLNADAYYARAAAVDVLDHLERLDPAMIEPLVQALQARNRHTKAGAKSLLARLGPAAKDAVPQLVKLRAGFALMRIDPDNAEMIAWHKERLGTTEYPQYRAVSSLALSHVESEADVALAELKKLAEEPYGYASLAALAIARIEAGGKASETSRVAEDALAEFHFGRVRYLEEGSREEMLQVLRCIQRLGDREQVLPVAQLWLTLDDPRLTALSIDILAHLASTEEACLKELLTLHASENADVARLSHHALLSLEGSLAEAVPLLVERLHKWRNASAYDEVRRADYYRLRLTLDLLAHIGPGAAPATEKLMELAENEHALPLTAGVLVAIGKPAVPQLIKALSDSDSKRAQLAAVVLGAIGPEAAEATDALIEALQSRLGDVRKAVTIALGNMGPQAVPPLFKLVKESRPAVSEAAIEALCAIGAPAVDELAQIARDRSFSRVRAEIPEAMNLYQRALAQPRTDAIRTLGNLGDVAAAAVPALMDIVENDPDDGVRHYAIEALGKIGKPAAPAVGLLTQLLNRPEGSDRIVHDDQVLRVLARIKAAGPSAEALARRVIDDHDERAAVALQRIGADAKATALLLNGFDSPRTAPLAATALTGAAGDVDALPVVLKALNRDDVKPRAFAALVAGRIGPRASPAVGPLTRIVKSEDEPALLAAAGFALGRIGEDAAPSLNALRQRIMEGQLAPVEKVLRAAVVRIESGASSDVDKEKDAADRLPNDWQPRYRLVALPYPFPDDLEESYFDHRRSERPIWNGVIGDDGRILGETFRGVFRLQGDGWQMIAEAPADPLGSRLVATVVAIEKNGRYVGYRSNRDKTLRAYVGHGTEIEELALPRPQDRFQKKARTGALDINDHGRIVGWAEGVGVERPEVVCRGAVWEKGRITRLRLPDETDFCVATAINNKHEIAGYAGKSKDYPGESILPLATHAAAYLWNGTKIAKLGGLEGATFSRALAFNDDGCVVGESFVGEGDPYDPYAEGCWKAWLWRDGKMAPLESLDSSSVRVNEINSAGQTVGCCDASACLWHAGKCYDLNATISRRQGKRWRLLDARYINQRGQIVALAQLEADEYRAVLLDPER